MAFDFLKKAVSKVGESLSKSATGFTRSVEKLKAGLAKTRSAFVGGLKSLLRPPPGSGNYSANWSNAGGSSDLGVAATTRIMNDLQLAYQEKRISTGDEVLDFLKTEMKT